MTQITMRDQMAQTITDLLGADERVVLLLAEISRTLLDPLFRRYPDRTVNVGIMEQTMIGLAAGLALEGFIPIAHSITPFLVERPFEQLKDDFCYQQLGGNFISIGASYDYSTEGMTHHAPGDVAILRSLPGMQIVLPGSAQEFDTLFRAAYSNGAPTYYRLSMTPNTTNYPVEFGKLLPLRSGKQATVIAVGPALDRVLAAVADLDVTVLYCTTVAPFDAATLRAVSESETIIVVEPYYAGALVPDICATFADKAVRVAAIGLPHHILHQYGTIEQLDAAYNFTPRGIRQQLERILNH